MKTTTRTLAAVGIGVALTGALTGAASSATAAPSPPALVQAYAEQPQFVSEDDGQGGMLLLVTSRGTGTSWTSGDPSVRKVTVVIQAQGDSMPGGFTGIGSKQAVRFKAPVVRLSVQTDQHLANCLTPVRTATLVTDRTGRTTLVHSPWVSGLSQPACKVFGGGAAGAQTIGNSWTAEKPTVVQTGNSWTGVDGRLSIQQTGNSWTRGTGTTVVQAGHAWGRTAPRAAVAA